MDLDDLDLANLVQYLIKFDKPSLEQWQLPK